MATFERTFSMSVPSSTQNLALVRDFVSGVGAQAGLNESDVANLELAVDEACANVMEHAYGDDANKEVVLRLIFDADTLRIHVIDTGRGFDPDDIRQEEIKQLAANRKTGGMGMRIIKLVMDEVHYDITPGEKNELQMVMKLRK